MVVQYLFDEGVEVPVILCPHGNAKKQVTPHCRTQKTTLDKLKHTVHDEAGGSFGASSISELPHDRRQIYNARQHGCSSGQVQDLILSKTCTCQVAGHS